MSPNSSVRTMLFGGVPALLLLLLGLDAVEAADNECFHSTSTHVTMTTWADIGNASDITDALTQFCSAPWLTNKRYHLYGGKTECVQVNNHSFTYQFAFLDPVTLPLGQDVTFTAPDCVQLGRAAVAECPAHGGQLSLVPPGDDATANVTIRAQPWSGPACTSNGHGREAAARKTSRRGTAAAAAARRIRSAVPVPGIEYDGCYNGTNALQNITWAMIDDTRVDILASLETVCANGHLGDRTYGANDPGVKRCIKTARGGFTLTIQGLAPWWNGTTVADQGVFLSAGGCVALGMEAIFKCDYGGYFTGLVVGPTADGTGQTSANVGVEPVLGDVCRRDGY